MNQSTSASIFWRYGIPFCLAVLLLLPSPIDSSVAAAAQNPDGAKSTSVLAGDVSSANLSGELTAENDTPMTSGEALIRKLMAGGWTMFFLLLVSVAGVAVTIERLFRLRRSSIAPLDLAEKADQLWQAGKFDELKKLANASPSTLGRMVSSLVRHRKSSHNDLSMIAGDIASRDLRRHLQRAYPLLVVATISPLLGLLGTIIGMVGAFSTIEALGELANPAAFGGDISKALITTGAGLAVAIPALAAYHFFKSRTLSFGVELEEVGSELITEWFIADDVEPPAKSRAQSRTTPSKPSQPEAPHAG